MRALGCVASALLLALAFSLGGCVRPFASGDPGTSAAAAPARGGAAMSRGGSAEIARSDPAAIERDVRYLAGDELEGRGAGSAGLREALYYVARRFRDLRLMPAMTERASSADPLDAYFQPFETDGKAGANVIGILPADPRVDGAQGLPSALIIAAHADHLGRDATLSGDQIYNGADDNASGVAALLDIARILGVQGGRERSVIFVVFSGEEIGLAGSSYFAAHPVVPLPSVIAMLNLDSVGRLRDERLYVFGMDSAREFPALLGGVDQSFGLEIVKGSENIAGSDQASFIAAGVPALHFFAGPHSDYHKVSDEADLINYAGLATIADYVAEVARYLSYRDRPLTFIARKGPAPKTPPPVARRASLGFMPDFAGGANGVRVAQVTPGGAAEAAGLRAGDIITAIDGESLTSLADYTAVLAQHAPGDQVRVTIMREGKELELPATLAERH